jgi:putative ABC transport system permease protein
MIGQFLYNEFNYNHDLKNIDNIYRLVDLKESNYKADYRIIDLIQQNIPGVKNACLMNHVGVVVNIGVKHYHFNNMLIVDPDFFKMFNYTFISGDYKEVFSSIDNVVLTESTAKIIFGSTNVIGKTLRLNHLYDMMITGIVKDIPGNISFPGDLFISSMNSPKQRISYEMTSFSSDDKDDSKCKYPLNVFVELNMHADKRTVEKQLSSFSKINDLIYPGNVELTPLKTNYLKTDIIDFDLLHGNISLIKMLSIIGVIILLLAVINFINLTTASYFYRMKELGVKKCLGADRITIIKQLLMESFFTCVISSVIGILFAMGLLPYFNQYIDKPVAMHLFTDLSIVCYFVLFIVVLTILAGLMPAIVLSGISPLQLFKANKNIKGTGKSIRGILTSFQFSIAIILITGLLVIPRQIDFVKHKDLGFNTDRLLFIPVHYSLTSRIQILANKLRQYHGTKSLTETQGIPGRINVYSNDDNAVLVIDSTSLNTFGFKIIKGRNLLPGDFNKACLINETLYKRFKGDGLHNIRVNGAEVVGVVSDFRYSSFYGRQGPLVLMYNGFWGYNYITMRISGPVGNAVDYLKKTWKEVSPEYPLDFGFYDEYFASMYEKEENLASFISMFSILAIVISCMGIFGLSVFQSEQRIKEIGIRKVLGASTMEIILLLAKGFSKWVIFSNIIAIPVAYYLLNFWLREFAYRIELSWWVFLVSGGITLFIALATISYQSIKTAIANPVEALRYE